MSSSTQDQAHPPGTFLLINDRDHGEQGPSKTVILDPVPSTDPNDPLNWSTFRKSVNFALVLAVTASVFTGFSIQIIFWQQMSVDLGLTYKQLNNSSSVNFVGLSLGCLLFIPFARKFGRRPIYLISTAVMAAMAFWTSEISSLGELYGTNFLYGLAGATNEAIVQITIADIAFVHHRGSLNALYLSMVMTGSFLAPMAAGAQASAQGWRWSYRTLGIVLTVMFILFVFFFEETKFTPVVRGVAISDASEPNELMRKNSRKQDQLGSVDIVPLTTVPTSTEHEVDSSIPLRSRKQRLAFYTFTRENIWPHYYRPLIILLTFPPVLFTGLQYASGVVWLTITASVLGYVMPFPPYNFTPAQVGYMSAGPFIGNLIGVLYGGFCFDRAILFFSRRNKGLFEPEMRLYLLHLPALAMAGGLIMFGVCISRGMSWAILSVGGALFGFGLGSIGDASMTYTIDCYREITGDAFTGISFLRNAISIGIPFAIQPWMMRSGLQNMFITCGVVSLAVSGLTIPMIFYGKRIRMAWAERYRRFASDEGANI